MKPSVLLFVLALGACAGSATGSAPAPAAAAVDGRIRTSLDATMFSRRWRARRTVTDVAPLLAEEVERSRRVVARGMAKYPEAILDAYLERVYVVRSLKVRGAQAGGTYQRRRVFLANPGRAAGVRDDDLERLFHAEFSSVLLHRAGARIDWNDWMRGTVPGFRYGRGGHHAIRLGAARLRPSAWTLQQGFLYEYGMSSPENDFNSYAGFLWMNRPDLWASVERYPGVRHKLELVLAFYAAIDPRLTRDYFRSL